MSRSRNSKDYVVSRERGPYRSKWDMVHEDKREKRKGNNVWLEDFDQELSGKEEDDTFFFDEEEGEVNECNR